MNAQLDLLALLDGDPIHADDRTRIQAAIIADGKAHGGRVDANRVRRALTNNGGHLDVYPRTIGPTYSGMVRRGLLKTLGYIDTNGDEAGRNKGKPAMAYELTAAGWSA